MTDIYRTPGSGPKPEIQANSDVTINTPEPKPEGRAIAMTPGEHYVRAEALLEELAEDLDDLENAGATWGFAAINALIAIAQVHATLATVDLNRIWPMRGSGPPLPEKI